MQFMSLFAIIALAFISVTNGAAVLPRSKLDVFVPAILTPNANTIWIMGTNATVTWDTSNAPVNISNGASVYLKGYGTLVRGFNLRDGNVTVQVPYLPATPNQHQIILFGDSGDVSKNFTITCADSPSTLPDNED